MTISTIDNSQRTAAKVVGFTYLFAMATSVFGFYARAHLIVPGNAAVTAHNIMASERLFRLGIASDLATFVTDIVLIAALYTVLRPINRSLALVAAFWRLMETATLVVSTLSCLDVLRLLSGADYLRVFEADRLYALARLSIGALGAGYNVGFVFLGLGSAVFSYLWLKSGYVPGALAVLGVFGSLLLAASTFAFIIFPDLTRILAPWYMAPIGIFEVTMGGWLLLRRLRPSGTAQPVQTGG